MADMTQRRRQFLKGLRTGWPVFLGYLPVSFAFAVWAVGNGLPWQLVLLISMTNFTSAGQQAGAGLLAAGAGLPEIGVTVLVINIRYMLMSLSLSQKMLRIPVVKRLLLANGVTDEIFFLAMREKGQLSAGFRRAVRRPLRGLGAGHPVRRAGRVRAACRRHLAAGDRPVCHVHRHRRARGPGFPGGGGGYPDGSRP